MSYILSAGKCYISRSPCAAMFVTKKYLVLMCLFRLELDNLPFFSKSMALLLSCISLLCAILYPCASMNYRVHSILAISFSTPISSHSVELFLVIFCFVEKMYTYPFPRDIMAPVCPRKSSCTAYEASTNHFTNYMSPTLNVSFIYLVTLRYFNTIFSFPQSS